MQVFFGKSCKHFWRMLHLRFGERCNLMEWQMPPHGSRHSLLKATDMITTPVQREWDYPCYRSGIPAIQPKALSGLWTLTDKTPRVLSCGSGPLSVPVNVSRRCFREFPPADQSNWCILSDTVPFLPELKWLQALDGAGVLEVHLFIAELGELVRLWETGTIYHLADPLFPAVRYFIPKEIVQELLVGLTWCCLCPFGEICRQP